MNQTDLFELTFKCFEIYRQGTYPLQVQILTQMPLILSQRHWNWNLRKGSAKSLQRIWNRKRQHREEHEWNWTWAFYLFQIDTGFRWRNLMQVKI